MAKKAATKKVIPKKASVKNKAAPAGKKPPTKKAPAKSAPAKTVVAKKSAPKAAKKVVPVKKVAKKVVAKKPAPKPAKKVGAARKAAKKTTPSAKTSTKKAPVGKTAPVAKTPVTKVKATAAPKKSISSKKPITKKVVTPKKPAPEATPVKKTEPKAPVVVEKSVSKKEAPVRKSESTKSASKSPAPAANKTPLKKRFTIKRRPVFAHLTHPGPIVNTNQTKEKAKKLSPTFLKTQRQKLLDLRDTLVDQMSGVARDSLGRGDEGSESSAFGMHQADAGSDAYDRDFALNILSQEQNALYEIDEALVRIDTGEYGICQGSGDVIPQARLEAMPFARCTVDFQEKLDQEQASGNYRAPVTSLFGLEEKEVAKPSDDEED